MDLAPSRGCFKGRPLSNKHRSPIPLAPPPPPSPRVAEAAGALRGPEGRDPVAPGLGQGHALEALHDACGLLQGPDPRRDPRPAARGVELLRRKNNARRKVGRSPVFSRLLQGPGKPASGGSFARQDARSAQGGNGVPGFPEKLTKIPFVAWYEENARIDEAKRGKGGG